jgi:hypothetical protein
MSLHRSVGEIRLLMSRGTPSAGGYDAGVAGGCARPVAAFSATVRRHTAHRKAPHTLTTTVESFYVDHRYEHEAVHFEENYLAVQLLRVGQRDAEHAERASCSSTSGWTTSTARSPYSREQVSPAWKCSPRPSSGSPRCETDCDGSTLEK